VIAEVAVRQTVHQTITQGIELRRRTGLRDAGTAAAGLTERRHGDVGGGAQGGTGRVGKVWRKFVES